MKVTREKKKNAKEVLVQQDQQDSECFFFYNGTDNINTLTLTHPNLTTLVVIGQPLVTLEGIQRLENLTELWIVECQLKVISKIVKCRNLKKLYLYSNMISLFPNMEDLIHLQVLWLSGNLIRSLEHLQKIPWIGELYLADNYISELGNVFQKLKSLQILNLSGNPITSLGEVYNLQSLPCLNNLMFYDPMYKTTPIVSFINYRPFVIFSLPNINTLDFFVVDEQEVELTQAYFRKKIRYYQMLFYKALSEYYREELFRINECGEELEIIKAELCQSAIYDQKAKDEGNVKLEEESKWVRRHLENRVFRWETNIDQWDLKQDLKLEVSKKLLDIELQNIGNIVFENFDLGSEPVALCQKVLCEFICPFVKNELLVNDIQVDRVVHITNRFFPPLVQLMELKTLNKTSGKKPKFYLLASSEMGKSGEDPIFDYIRNQFNFGKETEIISISNCCAIADSSWLNKTELHKKMMLARDYHCGKRVSLIVYLSPSIAFSDYTSNEDYVKKFHTNLAGDLKDCQNCHFYEIYNPECVHPLFIVEYQYIHKDFTYTLKEMGYQNLNPNTISKVPIITKELPTFPDWPTLTTLKLSKSNLKTFGDIPVLENIKCLDISYNTVETLQEVNTIFPNLEKLDASFNYIENLSVFMMNHLESLDLSWNSINNLLITLNTLKTSTPRLKQLNLKFNFMKDVISPTSEEYFVRKLLPNLKRYNGELVSRQYNLHKVETIHEFQVLHYIPEQSKKIPSLLWDGLCSQGSVKDSHVTVNDNLEVVCFYINGGKPITDIVATIDLEKVHWLSITKNQFTKISILTRMPFVEEVNFSKNTIRSLLEFPSLQKLLKLNLRGNYLGSLIDLKNVKLPSLKLLDVSKNLLLSLEGIENLTSLEEFNASSNNICEMDNISSIKLWKDLKIIDLTNNPIEGHFILRKSIIYHSNKVEFINGIAVTDAELAEATQKLRGCLDLCFLEKNCKHALHTNIYELSITKASIKKVDLNSNVFSGLTSLNLENNNLTSLSGFSFLPNLKALCLANNQINEYGEDLVQDPFPSLEILHLNWNNIVNLEPLQLKLMTKLTTLFIQDNCITNIFGLRRLKSLKHLILDRNKLTKIQPHEICELENLSELYVEGNQIRNLEFLTATICLKKLFIALNRIRDIEMIKHLRGLTKLRELTFLGNPVCRLCNHYKCVLSQLPKLKVLDGLSVDTYLTP